MVLKTKPTRRRHRRGGLRPMRHQHFTLKMLARRAEQASLAFQQSLRELADTFGELANAWADRVPALRVFVGEGDAARFARRVQEDRQ